MKYILSILLFLSTPVLAESLVTKKGVLANPQDVITLYDTPCVSKKVIAIIGPQYAAVSLAAQGRIGKDVYEMCWMIHVDHVDVIDENGESGGIGFDAFEPATEI